MLAELRTSSLSPKQYYELCTSNLALSIQVEDDPETDPSRPRAQTWPSLTLCGTSRATCTTPTPRASTTSPTCTSSSSTPATSSLVFVCPHPCLSLSRLPPSSDPPDPALAPRRPHDHRRLVLHVGARRAHQGDHEGHDGDDARRPAPDSRPLPAALPQRHDEGPPPDRREPWVCPPSLCSLCLREPARACGPVSCYISSRMVLTRLSSRSQARGQPVRLDRVRPDQLYRDEQAVGAAAAQRPLARPRPARARAARAAHPRRDQPRAPEPARGRRPRDVPPRHPPEHPRAGRQLQGRHRPGVPHGGRHPGARTPPLRPCGSASSPRTISSASSEGEKALTLVTFAHRSSPRTSTCARSGPSSRRRLSSTPRSPSSRSSSPSSTASRRTPPRRRRTSRPRSAASRRRRPSVVSRARSGGSGSVGAPRFGLRTPQMGRTRATATATRRPRGGARRSTRCRPGIPTRSRTSRSATGSSTGSSRRGSARTARCASTAASPRTSSCSRCSGSRSSTSSRCVSFLAPTSSSPSQQELELTRLDRTHVPQARPDLSLQDITALLVSLANLSLSCYPAQLTYIDQVLSFAAYQCRAFADSPDLHHTTTTAHLLALLLSPTQHYATVLTLLALPSYDSLLAAQPYATRRAVAHAVVASVLKNETVVDAPEDVKGVLALCHVLVRDQRDRPSGAVARGGPGQVPQQQRERDEAGLFGAGGYGGGGYRNGAGQGQATAFEREEMAEEQGWIARMVHLFRADDLTIQFQVRARSSSSASRSPPRERRTD